MSSSQLSTMSPSTHGSLSSKALSRVALGGLFVHAAFLPISIAGMQIALVVSFLALLALALMKTKMGGRNELVLPVLLFVGSAAASQAMGWFFLGEPGSSTYRTILAALVWMSVFQLDPGSTRRRALLALGIWSVAAAVPSLVAWPQHFFGFDPLHSLGLRETPIRPSVPFFRERYAASGFFSWYTRHGHTLTPVLCLLASFVAFARLPRRLRWAGAGLVAVIAAGIFLSFARTTWYGLVAATFVIAWHGGRKWLLLATSLFAIGTTSLVASHQGFRDRLMSSFSGAANQDRMVIWKVCTRVMKEHPIAGIGFGNFREVSRPYMDEAAPGLAERYRGDCHNSFFTRLIEGGPIFLLASLLFWLVPIGYFLRRRHAVDPVSRSAAIGGLALLAAMLVNALAHDLFVSSPTTYALGFGLVLATLLSRSVTPPEAPASEG